MGKIRDETSLVPSELTQFFLFVASTQMVNLAVITSSIVSA